MECMRAMASSIGSPSTLAIARSSSRVATARDTTTGRAFASLRVQKRSAPMRMSAGGGSKGRGFQGVVRASGADEVDEGFSEAGRAVEETKQSVGDKAQEAKQSFSSTVEDFKTVVGKAQSHAEVTASKELEKLKDITNQLLEQAELARRKLTATAQETAYKQKDNLAFVVENGPEPVKEVAETALNAHYSESGKKGSKIHDFCLGIPFGAILSAGGLLWFIIHGSTAAIRFGVLLGSAILFLSITSLKKWKQGEDTLAYIQGQAAITAFIFFSYYRRFKVTRQFFPTAVTGLLSGAMLGFYIYVLLSGGNPPKKPKTTEASSN